MAYQPGAQPEPEYDPEAHDQSEDTPAPLTSSDLIGQTFAGRYRFESLLGEGGFARVFKVYDLHRRVFLAAKVLRSDIAQEPMFLERFRREAAVLQRLQHPHIVRYYDIVESGDLVFILTDHIPGRTLQSVMRQRGGPLSPAESLTYLQPLSAALHFAHQEGVVHRDLKPANILLDENNNLYVTDFGIAKILSDASTLTMDATVGTPHFMSPEQILIGEVTVATDVYALGVLLYQMYTGRLPFVGDTQGTTGSTAAMRIVHEHLHTRPVLPSQINPALSASVEQVVLRCLEKDPAQRFQSVADVYEALAAAVIAEPSVLPASPSSPASPVAAPAVVLPPPVSEAERVPTGVGGMSRVLPADEYSAEEMEEEASAWGGKRKRRAYQESRRAARKAKRHPQAKADPERMSEKEREKEQEKERESQEKNDEKQTEKGWDTNVEKGEFWGDIGPSDRLGQFVWGGMILWTGIVFMIDSSASWSWFNPWAWIAGGAGALLLSESAARLMIPEYRSKPGLRLVAGAALLMLGLGVGFSIGNLWALILIAIGAGMLLSRVLE
ncbi:MAG: serine/threonine protein kinase [Chloroflexi bacterium]|nr:serine/threonine protein kinase [Chloroflexota bacterium]